MNKPNFGITSMLITPSTVCRFGCQVVGYGSLELGKGCIQARLHPYVRPPATHRTSLPSMHPYTTLSTP